MVVLDDTSEDRHNLEESSLGDREEHTHFTGMIGKLLLVYLDQCVGQTKL